MISGVFRQFVRQKMRPGPGWHGQQAGRIWRLSSLSPKLLAVVEDFGGWKAVEPGRGCVAVCADVFAVDQVTNLQVGQFLRLRNYVQRIARRAEDRGYFPRAPPERVHRVLAVVEQDAREGMIDPVIYVVAALAVALRFPYDSRHKRGRGRDHEASRLRQNLKVLREEAVQF